MRKGAEICLPERMSRSTDAGLSTGTDYMGEHIIAIARAARPEATATHYARTAERATIVPPSNVPTLSSPSRLAPTCTGTQTNGPSLQNFGRRTRRHTGTMSVVIAYEPSTRDIWQWRIGFPGRSSAPFVSLPRSASWRGLKAQPEMHDASNYISH
ncbi:hypothetical protein C8F01DRAFT_1237519 [Mycena amicta]|nr:hypothetical protein C8F01DRAFT_1237519 [Mycena amicta]